MESNKRQGDTREEDDWLQTAIMKVGKGKGCYNRDSTPHPQAFCVSIVVVCLEWYDKQLLVESQELPSWHSSER